MSKLIILSGPSCVGKGPLISALGRFCSHLIIAREKRVIHNSRSQGPGERDGVDDHFRTRSPIAAFREDINYPVGDARRTLDCFAALLQGKQHPTAERQTTELFEGCL